MPLSAVPWYAVNWWVPNELPPIRIALAYAPERPHFICAPTPSQPSPVARGRSISRRCVASFVDRISSRDFERDDVNCAVLWLLPPQSRGKVGMGVCRSARRHLVCASTPSQPGATLVVVLPVARGGSISRRCVSSFVERIFYARACGRRRRSKSTSHK